MMRTGTSSAATKAEMAPSPLPVTMRRSPLYSSSASMLKCWPSPADGLPSMRWRISFHGAFCSRYSRLKIVWTSSAVTSRPVSSVTRWMARLNSICKRRGKTRPCSCSSRYDTPPLPDWLFTRITAS
ncbi:hypothetical protein G6F35_016813 [Rhizopus arrhizus]|nr:hypothetical protein G6F35_016813 [Rhizopus arrhizus]